MKAVVVYDSFFGHTEKIARAIAGALGNSEDVRLARPGDISAQDLKGADLVVIGSPTRGFKASRAMQAFVRGIPDDIIKGVNVAAFDTRIPASEAGTGLRLIMKVGGYAAPRIAEALKKKGGNLVAPPEGFSVKEIKGPLTEGELERAAGWAQKLIRIGAKART